MSAVHIYTDGACLNNPGPGGWGALLLAASGARRELSGGEPETTNNRMELMAVIRALNELKGARQVVLFTDSQYVQQGITVWLPKWRRNGWRTANKTAVKNADLWKQLEEAAARHQIDWRWVRGHDGNEGNEIADKLAVSAARLEAEKLAVVNS